MTKEEKMYQRMLIQAEDYVLSIIKSSTLSGDEVACYIIALSNVIDEVIKLSQLVKEEANGNKVLYN